MDQYFFYQLSSGGGNVDNYISDLETYGDLVVYNDSPITLTGTFSINPTLNANVQGFSVKWQVECNTDGYAVSICGVTIPPNCLIQPGTFTCFYNGGLSPAAWEVQYFPDFIVKPNNNYGVETLAVTTSGSVTLNPGLNKNYVRLLGSPTTLVGSYTVDGATGYTDGTQFLVEISGNVFLNGENFTVFGQTIPSELAEFGNGMVIATYDAGSSTWRSILVNKNLTLNELEPIAALSALVNDTSSTANVTALQFLTDGGVLQRSGTTLTTGLLTSANFGQNAIIPQVQYTNISSVELLDAFNTPVTVLDAPAAGFLNWVQGIIVLTSTNVSPFVAYDTNTDVQFFFSGASDPIAVDTGTLGYTYDIIKYITTSNSAGANPNVILGQALQLQVPTGNPLNGTGVITVGVVYCVIPPVTTPIPLP